MKINKARLISEFSKLVSIDSKSFAEREVADYIKERLISFGFTITEDKSGAYYNGNSGNVYGYLEGSPGEPLLFCAHMDTVEPSAGKQAVIGDNGTITSNGKTVLGADDCSGIAAILEALHAIKEQNATHRPIEVLFTIAEELYCKGAARFDFSQIKSREAYVLDLTGPVGLAAYKAPTILSFHATITGKASHAGFAPQNGVHSIAAAANAISSLTLGRIDEETTLNVGVIHGGLATNIVPEQCVVSGEIRSYSHSKALQLAETVKSSFTDAVQRVGATVDFQTEVHCDAYETPLDHSMVKRFERVTKNQGLPTGFLPTFGGSDNNHLAKHGIPGLVIANAMNNCHSCQEYTTVEELCNIAELTLALMTEE